MSIDYFTVGVNATKAVIVNQLAVEDIERDEDEQFTRDAWWSYDRDSRED